MYIDTLELQRVRTFVKASLRFIHPDTTFARAGAASNDARAIPRPRLRNVTLLLGDNGSGKSTVLRTIAMATLGPALRDTQIRDSSLVRKEKRAPRLANGSPAAELAADVVLHEQDRSDGARLTSRVVVTKRGDLERYDFVGHDVPWEPVFETRNEAFFVVGYGATRRTERPENVDQAARTKKQFGRVLRVQSLFEDSFSLVPLGMWLPQLAHENKGRYKQVVTLIDKLIKPGKYRFEAKQDKNGDYLFRLGTLEVPFQSLSDGYRGFVGWVADLLYHICFGCPSGKRLVESKGLVLVDEIDLHLHPKWQMKVIATVARALPNMQFIFTSHSPLVASSLEWMNILTLKASPTKNITRVNQFKESVHGLDADQMLVTDFFGLDSTIAPAKHTALDQLTARIRRGDQDAPLALIRQLSTGTEATLADTASEKLLARRKTKTS